MSLLFEKLWANRIGGSLYEKTLPMYKFEAIRLAKIAAQAKNPEKAMIDFGIGEPDTMAETSIIEELFFQAKKHENRVYADNGCLAFNKAAAEYMRKHFSVDLNPTTQVLHCMGIKAALSLLPTCFINPGDITLSSRPGYPVIATHTRYCGGEVYELDLWQNQSYLPDLKTIPASILNRTKILALNYPNNPTGALASPEFYSEAIFLAKKYNFIIIQDAAYASLVFDTKDYLSILSLPGAKDVALELHSVSKSFSMTGWRMGWVCGNERLLSAYAYVKGNTDSGQFLPIQMAAIRALSQDGITHNLIQRYKRRSHLILNALMRLGFEVFEPKGTFFLYLKAPKAVEADGQVICFESAQSFSQWLIEKHSICTIPWDDCGSYIRFSMTFEAQGAEQEKAVADLLYQRLSQYKFVF